MRVSNDISRFNDRRDAGARLAEMLKNMVTPGSLVLSCSLNGLQIAHEIASQLNLDLDLLIKERQGNYYRFPDQGCLYPERLCKKYESLTGKKKTSSVRNRTVILTDEGVNSPDEMIRCIAQLQKEHPNRIIVALPVAPSFPVRKLEEYVSEVVCLLTPVNFISPIQFYENHNEITREEVYKLMNPTSSAA